MAAGVPDKFCVLLVSERLQRAARAALTFAQEAAGRGEYDRTLLVGAPLDRAERGGPVPEGAEVRRLVLPAPEDFAAGQRVLVVVWSGGTLRGRDAQLGLARLSGHPGVCLILLESDVGAIPGPFRKLMCSHLAIFENLRAAGGAVRAAARRAFFADKEDDEFLMCDLREEGAGPVRTKNWWEPVARA